MAWGTFLQVLTIAVSLLIAVGGWIWNDFSKRNSEERQRKEERYTALLASTKGFYQNADHNEAYELKKEHALGEFILEIRKDLFGKRFLFWGRTRLVWSDFRILTST
ncbi:MAG: hypothetical protein OXI54_14510 [Chloroflexota bacterium]|nr:hypothetical protein [Chloroflexota bacterium]